MFRLGSGWVHRGSGHRGLRLGSGWVQVSRFGQVGFRLAFKVQVGFRLGS